MSDVHPTPEPSKPGHQPQRPEPARQAEGGPLTDRDLLRLLGAGEPIAAVCRASGMSRDEFDRWWRDVTAARVPPAEGARRAAVRAAVEIVRDARGVPHVFAEHDDDLFFGLGYAMAQDRLFQMDYLRRKGQGRLAEVLGPAGVGPDLVARTIGLNRFARAEWDRLPGETRQVLAAFSAGVNALIEDSRGCRPVEFDLLDYEPEPWSPVDSLAIETELRWYLTGRFPVIVMPELARRTLGDGPLYREFLLAEDDEESIFPPENQTLLSAGEPDPLGPAFFDPGTASVPNVARNAEPGALRQPRPPGGRPAPAPDPDAGVGSNNWVVSGRQTVSGLPLLASDPHIAFEAVSCWYMAHLHGGAYRVAGMGYAGMPAIMFGRTERVAWGITNNLCSLRDLYLERTDPAHPGCFLYDGRWESARETTEVIRVKGEDPLSRTVRFSRNGPIVDGLLPPPADRGGPVSLKWLGAYHGGWLTALLRMNRAQSAAEFREALRPWHVPSFTLVFADVDGRIGCQTSGRIPLRATAERGYRPGWDPRHQWTGLVPFAGMPGVLDPPRGWMASANNRTAPPDYPYPLAGCWSSGSRAVRIRQRLESSGLFDLDRFRALQYDTVSLRAAACVPPLLRVLAGCDDERMRAAARILGSWDFRVEVEAAGAALFNVFFSQWARTVAEERFDPPTATAVLKGVEPAAARLLSDDPAGWFAPSKAEQQSDGGTRTRGREAKIVAAFQAALELLTARFGPDMAGWTWGRLHRMPLRHVLSPIGDLAALLDHGGGPVPGDMGTVCNTGSGPDWEAASGAGFRMLADLASQPPVLWAVDAQSQSGHPGSPHYRDQLDDWQAGRFHPLPLDPADSRHAARQPLILQPA